MVPKPALQEKDPNKWLQSVDPMKPGYQSMDPAVNWSPVTPDVAFDSKNGTHVEIYTSAGDNEGGMDWRPVNAFSYFVASGPKGKHQYLTLFNSLYDAHGAQRTKTSGTDRWQVKGTGPYSATKVETFGPTLALLRQMNLYDTDTEAAKYLHLLLAKQSMRKAQSNKSGFAEIIYNSSPKIWKECSYGKLGGCLDSSPTALMHSKYALFEQTLDSQGNVCDYGIWVTSANLNGSSGSKKSNTSLLLCGDKKAYEGLRDKVWDAQWAEKLTALYNEANLNGVTGDNPDFTFYPSPRRTVNHASDFEAKMLEDAVKLSGKSKCKAYLVHSLFSTTRGEILTAMSALKDQGCNVKIVLGENAIGDLVGTYFDMSLQARDVIDRVEFGNVHDKAISLSYTKGGKEYGSLFGGSSNLNLTSLEHDELSFRADDVTATRAAELQYERMYQLARGGKAPIAVTGVQVLPQTPKLNVGSTVQLKARVTPANATVHTVRWESSDESIATVTPDGKVTALKTGDVRIGATSVSGQRYGEAKLTVSNDSAETSEAADPEVTISVPPTLTMNNWQGAAADNNTTKIILTWGQGDADITGKVMLQYYSTATGKWTNYKTYTVTNGRFETDVAFKGSKTWRARAESVSKLGDEAKSVTIPENSTARYSLGYSYNVVQKAATAKPVLSAPPLVKQGQNITMVVAWKRAKAYPAKIRIQYKTKSGWKTKVTYDMNGATKIVGVTAGTATQWRVASVPKKGVTTVVSKAVKVKIA